MDFWMSSEKHILVGDSERVARNAVEPVISELLEGVELSCGAKKWSVITIVMPDERVGDYPEVKRYHKARQVIELRVQLPFYEFKEAGSAEQIGLVLDALTRSVDMMKEIKSLKITGEEYSILKKIVEKARLELKV
ncbi:hypothetical protein RTH46_16280 [Pseudomonas sp. zfem004]|uniref:hypothetical protein n=1 Tax=Pseudomonas sp. zfem004 TaxID=3078199 RepID=UPI0029281A24|nr:hypothetical protein [Pseudomonas sp. zfem004]MDU9404048.1 hypothetical protein [Pseudomonas sp. zfem004]